MVHSVSTQLAKIFRTLLYLACLAGASVPTLAQLETRAIANLPYIPFGVVSGDFSGNGTLDIAVSGGALSTLRGKGDGTFLKPVLYSYPLGIPIAVGDFNGDGKLDLVVTGALGDGGPSGNTVNVLLGNGDGTFQAPLVSPTTEFPTFVAVGDFNHDGKLDVVIVDPPYISVLLGSGNGTFQAPIDNDSFPGPESLAVADFNNDGRLDVAAEGYSGGSMNMGVLLGDGDGTLQPALLNPLNEHPYAIGTGNFNTDGNADVAVSDAAGVAIFLGKGNGRFVHGASYRTPIRGGNVVVEDFNGDGNLDLLLGGMILLLGNGNGTFQPAQAFPVDANGFAVGDFNGDHKPDVVALHSEPGGAVTVLNTGVVNFSPSTPVSFPSQLINTTSPFKTITLTNKGSTPLSISSIKISGHFGMGDACEGSVAAGANCEINVTFNPTAAGIQQGLVMIVDSASSKPQVIEVSGLGTALKLSPAALNFGDQKVGTTSPPQKITVTNESKSTVTFTSIGIGFDTEDFSESQNCGSQLVGGASCTATVTFTPTKAGPRKGSAFFDVVGGANPDFVVLTGTGTASAR